MKRRRIVGEVSTLWAWHGRALPFHWDTNLWTTFPHLNFAASRRRRPMIHRLKKTLHSTYIWRHISRDVTSTMQRFFLNNHLCWRGFRIRSTSLQYTAPTSPHPYNSTDLQYTPHTSLHPYNFTDLQYTAPLQIHRSSIHCTHFTAPLQLHRSSIHSIHFTAPLQHHRS